MAGSRAQTKLKRMIINFHHRKRRMKDMSEVMWATTKTTAEQSRKVHNSEFCYCWKTVLCPKKNKKLIFHKDFSPVHIDNLHPSLSFFLLQNCCRWKSLKCWVLRLSDCHKKWKHKIQPWNILNQVKISSFHEAFFFSLLFNIFFIECIVLALSLRHHLYCLLKKLNLFSCFSSSSWKESKKSFSLLDILKDLRCLKSKMNE